MAFRSLVLLTHRWVGLVTSVILSIAGLTGAIMVWPGTSLIRRASGRLHESLAMGRTGAWIVLMATAASLLLQLGGVYLWWRGKRWRVRGAAGWRQTAGDLHHVAGIFLVAMMFVLSLTAVGRYAARSAGLPISHPIRRAAIVLHVGEGFSAPMKVLYTAGSASFAVQGVTGVLMWWRPRRRPIGGR